MANSVFCKPDRSQRVGDLFNIQALQSQPTPVQEPFLFDLNELTPLRAGEMLSWRLVD